MVRRHPFYRAWGRAVSLKPGVSEFPLRSPAGVTLMRERIEQVGDILLAAAHADHHVEAAEIDRIEQILKEIWREQPTPDAEVRRVAQFREGETVDADEMARLGSMLR